MPAIPALIVAGGAIIGGAIANKGAKSAARSQVDAAREAAALEAEQAAIAREDQRPYREQGYVSLAQMGRGMQEGGEFNRNFTLADFTADPGYAFRMQEGEKGINRAAIAGGSRYSGATLKALTRFNSELGAQEYGTAYNRFQNNTSTRFNRLASLAGIGQTATNQTNASGAQSVSNQGQYMMNAGNARASGYVGTANAINGTIGTLANQFQQQQFLNSMNRPVADDNYAAMNASGQF